MGTLLDLRQNHQWFLKPHGLRRLGGAREEMVRSGLLSSLFAFEFAFAFAVACLCSALTIVRRIYVLFMLSSLVLSWCQASQSIVSSMRRVLICCVPLFVHSNWFGWKCPETSIFWQGRYINYHWRLRFSLPFRLRVFCVQFSQFAFVSMREDAAYLYYSYSEYTMYIYIWGNYKIIQNDSRFSISYNDLLYYFMYFYYIIQGTLSLSI